MSHGLHWIDFIVLALYAATMIALGWYYGRQQQSTHEYFTGDGSMNPVLIGVSMFATLFSTITYLTLPGEVLNHGPIVSLMGLLVIPINYYIVGYLIVPVYMRYRVTSAYALLESQLGLGARTTGALMFVLLRLMWMSTLNLLCIQSHTGDARPERFLAAGCNAGNWKYCDLLCFDGWFASRSDNRLNSVPPAVYGSVTGHRQGDL